MMKGETTFPWGDYVIDSHNLFCGMCSNIVRLKSRLLVTRGRDLKG